MSSDTTGGSESIPFVLASDVYFPLICCNLEVIDLMPGPTRACFTHMDCCMASLIDAESQQNAERGSNETSECLTSLPRVIRQADFRGVNCLSESALSVIPDSFVPIKIPI